MSPPPKSEAHRLIAELVAEHGPTWVEKQLGVSDGTVRKWLAKGTTPQPRIRDRVRDVLGVAVEAWTTPAFAPGEVVQPPAEAAQVVELVNHFVPGNVDDDARANAMAVLRVLRRHLEAADRDEVPSIANAITSSSRLLARLSGQLEITEAQIVRSVPWRKVVAIFEAALAPFPEAARAVAEALGAFGQ